MSSSAPIAPEEGFDDRAVKSAVECVPESEKKHLEKVQNLHQLKRSFEFSASTYRYRINAAVNLFATLLASEDTKCIAEARELSKSYFAEVEREILSFDSRGLVGDERKQTEAVLLQKLFDRNRDLYVRYSDMFPIFRGESSRQVAEFSIYLGGDASEADAEKLQEAFTEFSKSINVSQIQELEKIYGSIYKRFKAFFHKNTSSEELDDLYSDGKKALREQYLNKPRSETAKNLADAAAALIAAVDGHDNAILRMGELIVVKQTVNGITNVAIETISPELASELEKDPKLLRDPSSLLSMIPPECISQIPQEPLPIEQE